MTGALGMRIVTGVVLAGLAAGLSVTVPVWLFAVLVMAVMLAGLAEWRRLVSGSGVAAGLVAVLLIAAAASLFPRPQHLAVVCVAGMLFWIWQAAQLRRGMNQTPAASLMQGGVIFLCAWSALVWMRISEGGTAVVCMLLVLCSADIFAYLLGKSFGKRKLAPAISPGKTVAGLFGGLVGGLVAAVGTVFILNLTPATAEFAVWLAAALIAALFSVVGDLYESCLKRRAGVKDSGRLLPGHGGILDRLDGLLAGAPVFVAVWSAPEMLRGW